MKSPRQSAPSSWALPKTMDLLSQFAEAILPLTNTLWPLIAVFSRLSAFFLLVPVFGERTIPVRIRLGVALICSFLLFPLIEGEAVSNMSQGLTLILTEAVSGFALGLSLRLFVIGLQIIGTIISNSLSLSQPLGEGISTEPNPTISTFLMLGGLTLMVSLNLHVELIVMLARSFQTVPLGSMMDMGDQARWLTDLAVSMLRLCLSLALPFLVLNFTYNLILGFLNRAMPQLLVSFVGIPGITLAGIVLLMVCASAILLAWMRAFAALL